jgi:hypothetical protein
LAGCNFSGKSRNQKDVNKGTLPCDWCKRCWVADGIFESEDGRPKDARSLEDALPLLTCTYLQKTWDSAIRMLSFMLFCGQKEGKKWGKESRKSGYRIDLVIAKCYHSELWKKDK